MPLASTQEKQVRFLDSAPYTQRRKQMGIDIDSKFLVGLQYEDFPPRLQEYIELESDFISEYFYELGLHQASPYYDASEKTCFYGYPVRSEDVVLVIKELQELEVRFEKEFGCKPVVYAGYHVW
jgi:hypothetical protein